ncbi:MAG: universal stress protein [Bacteroidota bacterium]
MQVFPVSFSPTTYLSAIAALSNIMIKRIIVPIDFSPASEQALKYAEGFANQIEAKYIKVIHVFTPQTTADAVTLPSVAQLMEERQLLLDEFLNEHPNEASRVERQAELLLGFAADEIISQSKSADLVIMGSTGESGLIEQVFGSVSSTVALKSDCPVLLVPKDSVFSQYHNLVYASNNISLSRRAVIKLMDFNELFHARVHFVHVALDEKDKFKGQREKLFAPLFNNPDPEFSFEFTEIEADSIHEGLNHYVEEHPIDMAIMVTKQRTFWERLFHRSATKELTFNMKVPLMVFHLDD